METFEKLAAVIGPSSALRLLSFFSCKKQLYVPERLDAHHLIARLIGADKITALLAVYGGRTLNVPNLDLGDMKRAGLVLECEARGVPRSVIAMAAGVSQARISQIVSKLEAGDFDALEPKGGAVPAFPR